MTPLRQRFVDDLRLHPRPMSDRVFADAKKLTDLSARTSKLLLVSTGFESEAGLKAYRACVARDLQDRFEEFQPQWYNCSSGTGSNLLLSLSSRGRR